MFWVMVYPSGTTGSFLLIKTFASLPSQSFLPFLAPVFITLFVSGHNSSHAAPLSFLVLFVTLFEGWVLRGRLRAVSVLTASVPVLGPPGRDLRIPRSNGSLTFDLHAGRGQQLRRSLPEPCSWPSLRLAPFILVAWQRSVNVFLMCWMEIDSFPNAWCLVDFFWFNCVSLKIVFGMQICLIP